MKQRNEESWECANRACGCEIIFLMLGQVPSKTNPTCFCGCAMRRSYVKPRSQKREVSLPIGGASLGTVRTPAAGAKLFVAPTRRAGLPVSET